MKTILQLQLKLAKFWSKLLKAEVLHKKNKAAKLEQKIIQLEIEIKKLSK